MKAKTIAEFKEELRKYNPKTYISIVNIEKERGCICGYCYENVLCEPELEIKKGVWNTNLRNKPHSSECIDVLMLVPAYATHRSYE